MNEKRFFTKINKNGRNVIIDKECHIELIDLTLACEVLNRLDLKLKTYNEQLGEQQATIRKLQDLCGESDSENAKLRIENKRLKEELNDCEKFRYQVFKRLNDEHIKECSIK